MRESILMRITSYVDSSACRQLLFVFAGVAWPVPGGGKAAGRANMLVIVLELSLIRCDMLNLCTHGAKHDQVERMRLQRQLSSVLLRAAEPEMMATQDTRVDSDASACYRDCFARRCEGANRKLHYILGATPCRQEKLLTDKHYTGQNAK